MSLLPSMNLRPSRLRRSLLSTSLASLLALGAVSGCADASSDGGIAGHEGSGVGQGGAQDFGQFKEILEDGGIPGPETLDDVGFFNEHKIELPAPDCGEDVCIHGLLGVMGNMISGSNCTTVLIGMNTPIDASELERPPLNLALAVDVSGSMAGESINAVREGLQKMMAELRPEDRVTLVAFSTEAAVIVESVAPDDANLGIAIANLTPNGGTNIYDGLRSAYEIVDAYKDPARQNRVILLSDGLATAGITQGERILGLASAYGERDLGLTTIGLGSEFDVELMRGLSEQGAGSFYFVEDPQAIDEVFVEEANSFLVPLARRVEIDLDIFAGYDLRRVYGTKQFEIVGNSAFVEIPTLQIAHRSSASEQENGRRGGGGAILVELLPTGDAPQSVGDLNFVYDKPDGSGAVTQEVKVLSPLDPWETPVGGHFEHGSVEKGFVMLNLYVGFQMAAERAKAGDDAGALAVLNSLEQNVGGWESENPDADIEDDLVYVRLFIENLRARNGGTQSPSPVSPEPWPAD